MAAYPQRKHSDVMREAVALKGAAVLDVGCGDGSLVRFMTRQGARTTGLEIDEGKLARARAAEPAADETYRVGRGEALPFEAGSFDLVVFFNSLHHVPAERHDAALSEAARVLPSGGRLYVLEPLAEGAFFALMRPVDDETEVRAAAYRALARARAPAQSGGLFTEVREYAYDSPYAYASFEALKDQVLAVDERRRAPFEAQEADLRARFETLAEHSSEGFGFSHPSRLNLLRRS